MDIEVKQPQPWDGFSENMMCELHVTTIDNMLSHADGFLTESAIRRELLAQPWVKTDLISTALERLIQRRQAGHDKQRGYCQFHKLKALQWRESYTGPKKTRAEFDRLPYAEQSAFCRGGGIIT